MNLLRTERDTLDTYIPGLDKYLAESRCSNWSSPATARCRNSAS